MKTIATTQRNTASTLHAHHSTHNVHSPLRRLTLLVTLLMTFALGARAAEYVFTYTYGNNTYFLGQSTTPTTSFVPNTSIYTGNSGSTFRNANGYYIRYNNGLGFNTTSGTNLTITNDNIAYVVEGRWGDTYYYLNMDKPQNNNRAWRMSETYNYRATAYTVTTSSVINNFTISGEATIKAVGAYNYTHTNATYYDTYEFNNKTYYSTNASQAATTTEPANNLPTITNGYTWTIENNSYATVNASTGAITVNSLPTTATEVTLTCSISRNGVTKTATKTITLQQSGNTPTAISASDFSLAVGTDDDISYTLTGTAPIYDKVEATSSNTGIFTVVTSPTSGGKVTLHPVAMGNATLTLIAKAKDGTTNACSTTVKITVAERVKTPAIEYEPNGAKALTTITCTTEGATIYYTIDGSEPNPTSHLYENPFEVDEKVTVKAMAVKTGYINSIVASRTYETSRPTGIDGGVVTLNDLEDHNWTYYQSDSPISSPNPRNVKITYEGNGGAVGIDAPNQVNFVYYKTLESEGNNYPYTTIANPFSKRPSEGSGNSKTYKGFKAWRVKSITGGSITNYAVNSEIPAETDINFVFSSTYSTNCISAEIVLEAVWTTAYIVRCSVGDINNNLNNAALRGSSYETNFIVVNSGNSSSTAINANTQKSVTITMVEPDGSEDYRNSSRYINPQTITLNNALKFEYINMNNNNTTINANAMNLVLGRGIANTTLEGVCANYIRGINGNKTSNLNYQLRIESGIYNYLSFVAGRSEGGDYQGTGHSCSGTSNLVKGILGCDYDRSTTTNTLLKVRQEIIMGYFPTFAEANKNRETFRVIARSGDFTSAKDNDIADAGESFYLSLGGDQTYVGRRMLIIEGGQFLSIAGGIDEENPSDALSVYIRMKGGIVRGSIYGCGAFAATSGHRKIVVTGGTVHGWIAAGCNGTSTNTSGGILPSDTYVYVGGNAIVGYKDGTTIQINTSEGGNVFGAGSGNSSQAETGRVKNSTVVIADDAYIQKNVYGGGNYGYTQSTANVLISGGMINGSVFGGSNQKQGATINLTTTGGEILGGVYGGSNVTGTISGNVTMQINGGHVGTSSKPANIHGGGYGQSTIVTGNVNLTLGTSDQTSEGVTVWGDVYGGSALGKVNCTVNNYNNYQYTNNTETNVTLYKGTINGSLYGGALGGSNVGTHVYGPVKVEVYGGSVKKTPADGSGGVYGANNKDGAPQRSVTVDIYGTDSAPAEGEYALYAVYGGGNQADYLYGNGYPKVTVHYCDNSIEYVYGGGNAAAVAGTDVTIWGGNVIGNVFGGGHGYKDGAGADVEGDVNVAIKGGTIKRVFGGSNSKGNISGTINLEIDKDGDCDMRIGEVYGGGNEAAGNAGTITIGCTGALVEGDNGHVAHPEEIGKKLEGIGAVYGGANNANVTNDNGITLNINSGMVANAFGGNNTGGAITGGITVNINKNANTCGWYVGNVYGAGNLAQYSGSPAVNILNGEVSGNVYGGGKGDANDHSKGQVTGNPTVTIGDNANAGHTAIVIGDVYGGGDAGNVVGIPVVNVVNKCNTTIGNVYGGGNAADVNGTDVTIDGGTITGMVFGGGHGDKDAETPIAANVGGDVSVVVTGGTINKVFGGSNSKGNIGGDINLTIEKADGHCDMHIAEVYGGGNEASGNAGTITIGCTGGEGEGIGDVYGGANAADINTPITLNITGGNISRVFGGNNTSGSINGDIQVNVDWTGTCGVNALGNVYGAGNQAAYSGNTEVNILNGTVTGSVYGGGLGATAVVTGTTTVNIDGSAEGHSVAVTQNVLGGGDAAAVTGSTDVNIINGTISGSVFGGGNAAGVSKNGVVDVTGGTIASGVYGGSNASGTVGNTTVTLANGIIGTDAAHANVHGGGYGKETKVSGNVAVNIKGGTIYGDVYGGSALGTVNTNTSNTTAVNLTGGLVHGDAYGGGLGDSTTAADVNGNVTVTLNGTAFTLATTKDNENNIIPTSGRVFGCNNINGSPKGTVLVKVLKTVARDGEGNVKAKPTPNSGVYELQAVYGGGNLAAYNPTDPAAEGQFTSYTYGGNTIAHDNTDKPVQVVIDGCEETSIEYVYGGGNAAATPATDVTVLGSYEIGSVFGGGNGKDKYTLDGGTTWNENNGADVGIIDAEAYSSSSDKSEGKYGTGNAMTSVLGGTVHNIFGGSNTLGNIVGEAIAYLDAASDCELNVDGIYGGGNEAYMDGSSGIQLGCIESLGEIYGGARNADVGGDINLTITSGHFGRVFGGNNLGGWVKGSITVNIEETGCNPITIGELYGCGNKAPYKTPGDRHPTINIRSFTSIGNVYGGGLGKEAVVEGNPTININVVKGVNNEVEGWPYNDGRTIDFGDGSKVTLPVHETGKIGAIGNVFGGGNAAAVIGNTQVNIGTEASVVFESLTGAERTKDVEGADIRGNVYGGGNEADVTGKTNVVIGRK